MRIKVVAYSFVGAYSQVEYGTEALVGNVSLRTFNREDVPKGWTILEDCTFDPSQPTYVAPNRLILKVGQTWRPKINCRTYAPKKILTLANESKDPEFRDEISYRCGGEHAWCEIGTFFWWIFHTEATLVESGS